ncbi:hypothetical protein BH11MYX3_BH11MYX3_38580 [soil metagenome]
MSSGSSERRPGTSLAIRITAWYVGAFIATLALLAALAIPAVHDAADREDAIVVDSTIERHLAVLATSKLPAYREAVEQSERLGERPVAVRVQDASGRTLYQHGDLTATVRAASRTTRELRLDLGALDAPSSAMLGRLRPGVLALAVAGVVLALVGGFYVTRRGLAPIRDLAATADAVSSSGDLSRRVPERGTGDELDELSRLFNRMLDRNQALVRGMREALDNVAHDLRTPLTRLRGSAEVALRTHDGAVALGTLADTVDETDQVLAMLRTLMDISEAENGLMRLHRERASLAQLAANTVELYAHVAEEAGVTLSASVPEDVVAMVDPMRIRQALANLVDHAIKYTPHGGAVTIEVLREHTSAVVRVRDTGEGISPDVLPRIWERLYRGDPSRAQPGLGLGLSLVKAVVEAHGGTVSAASEPGHGATFTICIPRTT